MSPAFTSTYPTYPTASNLRMFTMTDFNPNPTRQPGPHRALFLAFAVTAILGFSEAGSLTFAKGPGGYQPFRQLGETFDQTTDRQVRSRAIKQAYEQTFGSGDRPRRVMGSAMDIDADLPGYLQALVKLDSGSPNVRKGILRELRLAGTIHDDARFDLQAFGEAQRRPGTNLLETDRDLVYRHRASGRVERMEVKEVRPETMRKNPEKYRKQMRKIASDGRRTGNSQVYVNRYEIPIELQSYAKSLGLPVYERVRTGQVVRPGETHVISVLDERDHYHRGRLRQSRLIAGAGVGAGVYLVASESMAGVASYRDWSMNRGSGWGVSAPRFVGNRWRPGIRRRSRRVV